MSVGAYPLLASLANWPIFPENGLDRSLHAPVLIGLLLVSFFAETLGWTYAGLVVPGYLASVFIAAPVTGALVVVEAALTYLLTAIVGLWLPRTGAWSSSFGRERFFLFIVSAILVRLAIEGNFLPWLSSRYVFSHSRELYSLGLVLVPLLANAFWNAGLLNALPRLGFITLITFACVNWVLLPHTNFTMSRFAIANEAVSLAFLESPHAHIILLIGALLGARNNLLYGWDYNGILVPGLLAVAWYQPTKLATTMVEAVLIFWIARAITSQGPLKKLLIVGSRRMVVVFLVGFVAKCGLGFAIVRWAPSVQMVDYFGFGYLLPSLLAVKMWNKQKVFTVIMPTLQVSLLGFVAGNAVGFALSAVDLHLAFGEQADAVVVTAGASPAFELMLGDSAPAPRLPAAAVAGPRPSAVALLAAQELSQGELSQPTRRLLAEVGISIVHDPLHGWLTLTPRTSDPDEDRMAPRLAVRGPTPPRAPWLVVAVQSRSGSAVIAASQRVAELLDARALVVRSRLPEVAAFDDAFADGLLDRLQIERVLIVTEGARSGLDVVGAVPPGFDLNGLAAGLGVPLQLSFRAASAETRSRADTPRLELTPAAAEQIGARRLGAPELEQWPGNLRATLSARINDLTQVGPRGYRGPSIEELRVFAAVLWPAIERLRLGTSPSAWERAVAARLDYHFVRLTAPRPTFLLCELPGAERRGSATFAVSARTSDNSPAIEVPAVRWERGTLAAGLSLHAALESDLLLIPGALPNAAPAGASDLRKPQGRRSFFHQAHEQWLSTGGHVLALQGITPERESDEDAVLSFGREVAGLDHVPAWSASVVRVLTNSGVRLGVFDGAARHAAFEGAGDPAFEYARRFADEQMAVLWLSARLRDHWTSIQEDERTGARLELAAASVLEVDVAARAAEIASCLGVTAATLPHCKQLAARCDPKAEEAAIAVYARTQNPYDLLTSVKAGRGCALEWLRDLHSQHLWLLAMGSGQARLVPLQGSKPTRPGAPALTTTDFPALVALGIASAGLSL
ncbi:MAG TPA: poly-gamma-glutamate biosynthesis protein PgsC/CapC [Polyangiaceae bacterium]|nr:poly-gamma-glutamate biosynthesis protein PgsC/CapC [Polyangiaceae bacterium]